MLIHCKSKTLSASLPPSSISHLLKHLKRSTGIAEMVKLNVDGYEMKIVTQNLQT